MERLALTAKVQVYVTDAEEALLDAAMSAYRDACDHVSGHVFRTHDLKQSSLNEALYRTLRERFGLKAQMAQSVLRTVAARYKAILEGKDGWTRIRFRTPQCDLVWNRDYSLSDDRFSVNTLEGRVKLKYASKGMEKYFDHDTYRFGTARLVKKHGRYFLHIGVTCDAPECDRAEMNRVVCVDRGINFVAATYDSAGKSGFVSGRAIKQKRAKYSKLRKGLQKRRTPSSRRRLKVVGQRENRWMQDVNHQVSKALAEKNPEHTLFVLEDLSGIRAATERVRTKDRYVTVSWSFYDLEQKLDYKAERRRSAVIEVDPRHTSQCCPMCGHVDKANRDRRLHLFTCRSCGYKSNDDRVAAMNLYRMGRSYLRDGRVPDTVADGYILSARGAVSHPAM